MGISKQELEEFFQPPEKINFDASRAYFLLKKIEEMPEEAVLQEELGPTFEAYREAAQREINFSIF